MRIPTEHRSGRERTHLTQVPQCGRAASHFCAIIILIGLWHLHEARAAYQLPLSTRQTCLAGGREREGRPIYATNEPGSFGERCGPRLLRTL